MSKLFRILAWGAFAAVLLAGLAWASQYSYLLFHGLVEVFCTAVAWAIFFLAWNTRHFSQRNGYLLFLGAAYFMVGGVGLLHTLAYKGMGVFPGASTDLPTQLWIVARYLEAAGFFGAALLLGRRVVSWAVLAGWCLATLVLLGLVFWGGFPVCHVAGVGLTAFKKYSEYGAMAIMVLAAVGFTHRRSRLEPEAFRCILLSILASLLAEMLFTFYVGVYDITNILGHFFKLVSFWFVYRAIVEVGLSRPLEFLVKGLKRTEEELRKNEELLNEAGEIARIGGWEVILDNRTIRWSEEVYRIHGVEQDFEITMENAVAFYHPEDRPVITAALEHTISTGEPYSLELRLRPRTGGEIWVRTSCRVHMENDRPVRLAGVFQDITQAKRDQAMREEVDRIIQHDLKSPIAALTNMAGLLREEIKGAPDHARMLEAMEESGKRMMRMLSVSKDLFKMENGEYEPDPEPVDLLAVCRGVVQEQRPLAMAKDLKVHVLADGEERVEGRFLVLGEPVFCESMLANLLVNAMEAAPEGSTVTVDMRHNNGRAEVAIHNQGAVPQEVRGRFFEKYATWGKRHGTGLGTYSARLMARTLGGDLRMETSEEQGTTLTVELPAP